MTMNTFIVGIGSPHGDDQAGWLVAERLAEMFGRREDVAVRKATSPAEILAWLDNTDRLIVCDACRGLGRVGKVKRWTWPDRQLVDATLSGTHDLSLPATLRLADRLDRLPQSVAVWSVEGTTGTALATLSSEVTAALPTLIANIADEANQVELCTNGQSSKRC